MEKEDWKMVHDVNLDNWAEFEDKVNEIKTYNQQSGQRANQPILFRGQSKACWGLETTLERDDHREMRFIDYYDVISSFRLEIETLTESGWQIPDQTDLRLWVEYMFLV